MIDIDLVVKEIDKKINELKSLEATKFSTHDYNSSKVYSFFIKNLHGDHFYYLENKTNKTTKRKKEQHIPNIQINITDSLRNRIKKETIDESVKSEVLRNRLFSENKLLLNPKNLNEESSDSSSSNTQKYQILKDVKKPSTSSFSCNFICLCCKKSFSNHSNLNRHIKNNANCEKEYMNEKNQFQNSCEICQMRFRGPAALSTQQRAHNFTDFQCKHCNLMCKTFNSLKIHTMYKHQSPKHTCDLCGKKFHLKKFIRNHIQNHLTCRSGFQIHQNRSRYYNKYARKYSKFGRIYKT